MSATVQAQPREHREREFRSERQWHGWHGDIHRFHERDVHRWRGGHWYHGRYGGRLGWWWADPFTPPAVVAAPPAAPPPAVAQAPAATWYYCDAAQAYYPYVAECPSGWRPVPAR